MTPPSNRRAASMARHPSGQLAEVYVLHPQPTDAQPWHHQPLRAVEPVTFGAMRRDRRTERLLAGALAASIVALSGVAVLPDRRPEIQILNPAAHVYNLTSGPVEPIFIGPSPG
jgi:hypothetical protein